VFCIEIQDAASCSAYRYRMLLRVLRHLTDAEPNNTPPGNTTAPAGQHNQCCAHTASFKNGTVNNDRK
jgi:hypothetical protein